MQLFDGKLVSLTEGLNKDSGPIFGVFSIEI